LIDFWITIIGVSMAFSGVPQIIKLYQRKRSDDISISLWLIVIHGQIWWIIYGFKISNNPMIISNIFCIIINLWILILIFQYRRRKKK